MIMYNSKDSRDVDSNAESNNEEKSGIQPVFVMQWTRTVSPMPINDVDKKDKNTAPEVSSSLLGLREA